MEPVDQRLREALRVQFAERDTLMRRGAVALGWKVGASRRERLGGSVIGHLTSATRLRSGDEYRPGPGEATYADAEVAVAIAPGGVIAGYGVALELCDLAGTDEPAVIVARNVFHRAFALGPFAPELTAPVGQLLLDGRLAAEAPVPADLSSRVERVAELLAAMSEELRTGETIITGSVVQVAVAPGQEVRAGFPGLGQARTVRARTSPPGR
ncbi:hypothetical protein GCM10027445_02650 [Amycolatopsis endophytica]|uniref:2-keto-4-pentenoate hydratase n=1 Tax=Amycolatopsis endophytica TaxID=860233 RepID=A0A853BAG0_9PSEU|nr:hypothetical protein [Amycolatopsis endophytica]NYI91396.1 hypothetical protein [Amycolatopsis endophytica]